MIIRFDKLVGKTIAEEGRVTVPKKFDTNLDNDKYCALGHSVEITYCLQSGPEIPGRLYQSQNNTGTYYQFYIPDIQDSGIFKDHIASHKRIRFDFDLESRCLYVSPRTIE